MRGLKRNRSARILAAGHAFVQNLRRDHYDIATDTPTIHRLLWVPKIASPHASSEYSMAQAAKPCAAP